MPPKSKRCKQCGEDKPLSEFYNRPDGKYGVAAICKICRCLNDGFTPLAWREPVPEGYKRCVDCKQCFPATPEYFHRTPDNASGLHSRCKPCRSAKRKREYRENPEQSAKARQRSRDWRESNPERHRAAVLDYLRTHRREAVERVTEWRKRNPDRYRQHNAYSPLRHVGNQRRRARKYQAEGTHTLADIERQYKRQRGKCYWCGMPVGDTYHVDHVVPLVRGGSDDPSNLVIACVPCNLSKGDKLPHEWKRSGRLL